MDYQRYDLNVLGINIRHFRSERNLTKEEFAERTEVSVRTIYNWESGINIPETEKLLLICRVLKVEIGRLLVNN